MASPFVELEIGERTVKVTNPDKVLFPDAGHTKRDLVDYYLAVGDGIVRALRERPTQLRRFPDGIAGEQIYQKRIPEKRPEWVEAARVTFPAKEAVRLVAFAWILSVGFAISDELHQAFVPGRHGGDVHDLLADAFGAFVGASVHALAARRRASVSRP